MRLQRYAQAAGEQMPGDDFGSGRREVFAVIDNGLADLGGRSLVSGAEVVDLLLDLRSALASALDLELLGAPTPG